MTLDYKKCFLSQTGSSSQGSFHAPSRRWQYVRSLGNNRHAIGYRSVSYYVFRSVRGAFLLPEWQIAVYRGEWSAKREPPLRLAKSRATPGCTPRALPRFAWALLAQACGPSV